MPSAKRIGLIVPTRRTYGRGVLRGVAQYIRTQTNWECILLAEPADEWVNAMAKWDGDGLIAHCWDRQMIEAGASAGAKFINVSNTVPPAAEFQVVSDDYAVGVLAAEHLISQGFRKFAYLGIVNHYYTSLRGQGYRDAITKAGFEVQDAPGIVNTPDCATDAERDAVAAWAQSLPRPCGVLASNDQLALNFMDVCRKLSIRIPEQLAVMGVDNDEIFCDLANPPLSSVALSVERIGFEAARLLDNLMRDQAPKKVQMKIPPLGAVVRTSTDVLNVADPVIAEAVRYIRAHAQDDLQVEDVLRIVNLSRRSFEQRFRAALGITPAVEIRRVQIDRAKRALRETDQSMPDVALASGFRDAKQLSSTFHKMTRMTPSEYRRQHRIG
jgi:LacI family transcriptional regulator